ncbi:MAG: hypothetical protein LBL79_08790 [Prevotella sp.]|jgi:hypothetical protein|nr:hypothetical protein [Prevotella sp.]
MKKLVNRIILLIAAVAVFFTGAGVTCMIYCCSGCETEQMLVVTKAHSCCLQKDVAGETHSCCASHTHHTQPSGRNTDADGCATRFDEGHCRISRLSADIDLPVFRPQVSSPFVWISDVYPVLLSGVLSGQINDAGIYSQFESPPNIPPREYLSLIRVLII